MPKSIPPAHATPPTNAVGRRPNAKTTQPLPPGARITLPPSGDVRVRVALLMAKDAEESLDPLNEIAGKLEEASQRREAIRRFKETFNRMASTSEASGHEATLTVLELDWLEQEGAKLGIDTTVFETIRSAATDDRGATVPTADGEETRAIGLVFNDTNQKATHEERQGWLDDCRAACDDAMEATREKQTTQNFQIQLRMQNHTNLYTASSQTLSELKRQNGSVKID